jgi:hypothetical protein
MRPALNCSAVTWEITRSVRGLIATTMECGTAAGCGQFRKAEKPCSSQPRWRYTVLATSVPSGSPTKPL